MPFEPGRSGNPAGGPVGSRHRQQLNGEFIAALLRDFRQGGAKAIERVRRTQPAAYLKILALLMPREHKVEHHNLIANLTVRSWRRRSRPFRRCWRSRPKTPRSSRGRSNLRHCPPRRSSSNPDEGARTACSNMWTRRLVRVSAASASLVSPSKSP